MDVSAGLYKDAVTTLKAEMAIESNRVEPNRASNSVFLFETRFNRTEPNRGPVRLGSIKVR